MIDIIIVASYLILLLSVGIYKSYGGGDFKSFASIKDNNTRKNTLLLIATIFVSSVGGGATFGIAEKTYSGNVAYTYALFLVIPIDLLIAKYIVPKLVNKHYGSQTVGDIMFVYYGNIGRIIGGFASLAVCIGLVAAQISISGRIFQYILQIDYIKGIIISYGVVIIYTTIGGLRSILFTNQIQFFTIIIAVPIVAIFGLHQIGISQFIKDIPSSKVVIYENYDFVKTTISAALGFASMNMFPAFIQRALINQDSSRTKKAIYIKTLVYAVFLVFITINGLLAYLIYPSIVPSLALPYLIDHIIPIGIQGFVIAGLLAAVMSTADSDLNVTSITLVKDFAQPIFGLANQHNMLILARFANVIIGSFSILIALLFDNVVDLVIFMSGFWGPLVLAPLVLGLYDMTITRFGMIISSSMGLISFFIWERFMSGPTSFKSVFIGTMVNFILFMFFVLLKKFKICSCLIKN